MICYSDLQAEMFSNHITDGQGFGTLQAWALDPDPYKHAQKVLDYFWPEKSKEPTSVLDVGCGTCEMLYQAGERWPTASLVGVNYFSSQLPTQSLWNEAMLFTGDFEKMNSFADSDTAEQRFDLVMMCYALGHFSSLESLFSKLEQRLSPKGRICIYDIGRRSVKWKQTYGYRLWSQREIYHAMERLGLKATIWSPQASLSEAVYICGETEEDSKHCVREFESKTLPLFIIGEQ